jgi:hypothetical protein
MTTNTDGVPRPTDDELWDQTIQERDQYHEWADKLAAAIADHFGIDIGEHSNLNNPWSVALDTFASMPQASSSKVQADHIADERNMVAADEYRRAGWWHITGGFAVIQKDDPSPGQCVPLYTRIAASSAGGQEVEHG